MAENSNIEWTTHTFNPWIGCQKVGPGCDHCYAEVWDARGMQGHPSRWGAAAKRTKTGASNWSKPHSWDKAAKGLPERPRVFCASLADVFDNHSSIDDSWRRDLGKLIEATPNLDWMLLTKRIGNAARYLAMMFPHGVPANVWLGATVVTQEEADRDLRKLRHAQETLDVSVTFLSMEPLLEQVTLDIRLMPDLVIVGGESGPHARPMHPDWVRSLRDQCISSSVAFHFKQWGEWSPCTYESDPDGGAAYPMEGCCDPDAHTGGQECIFLHEGEWVHWPHLPEASPVIGARRVGKKRAGRLLDGRTWDEMPGARHADAA